MLALPAAAGGVGVDRRICKTHCGKKTSFLVIMMYGPTSSLGSNFVHSFVSQLLPHNSASALKPLLMSASQLYSYSRPDRKDISGRCISMNHSQPSFGVDHANVLLYFTLILQLPIVECLRVNLAMTSIHT